MRDIGANMVAAVSKKLNQQLYRIFPHVVGYNEWYPDGGIVVSVRI
ncbi:hypothetical protein [Bifidobacterium castoris]|uniref:Uncharacterized protein n=1 Tax=Bifidobacterium castoris TaxID=2306972 RepID=A0A430F6T4_9BIFI|nr:hypothetical protein [Bifidobacterium castoris]RSX48005.1 hypothetical protein D2E22_1292 [Bifidobacterium castoris]